MENKKYNLIEHRPYRKSSKEEKRYMKKLRNKGHSFSSIGKEFGLTKQRVHQILMYEK